MYDTGLWGHAVMSRSTSC